VFFYTQNHTLMKTPSYSVYILQSEMDGSYYVGSSADPVDRLAKHNRPHKGYTASKQPWKLIFVLWLENKTMAQKKERHIKAMKSKKYLEDLIGSIANELMEKICERR